MQEHEYGTTGPAVSSLPGSHADDQTQCVVPDCGSAPRDWSELGRRVLAEAARQAQITTAHAAGYPFLPGLASAMEPAKEGSHGRAVRACRGGHSANPVPAYGRWAVDGDRPELGALGGTRLPSCGEVPR